MLRGSDDSRRPGLGIDPSGVATLVSSSKIRSARPSAFPSRADAGPLTRAPRHRAPLVLGGNTAALDRLVPLLYDDLRRVARRHLRRERHPLQHRRPTWTCSRSTKPSMRCRRSTSGSVASWNCDSLPGSTSLRRPTRSVCRRPRSSANGRWQRPGFTNDCRHRKNPRPVRIQGP